MLFFKPKVEYWIIVLGIFFTSVGFNFNKVLTLSDLNNYNNIWFWKFTSILNNLKLNLPSLIILTIALFLYLNNFNKITKTILYVYTFYIFKIWFLNDVYVYTTQVNVSLFFKKYNIALLNGALNIHPWLIFLFYCYVLFFLIFFYKTCNSLKNWWSVVFILSQLKWSILICTSTAIILGAYWAFQELSWGGWWNWDAVELISLSFLFFFLLLLHSPLILKIRGPKNLFLTKSFFIFVTIALVVRFNLLSSIHAFVDTVSVKLGFLKFYFIIVYNYIFYVIFLKFCDFNNRKIFNKFSNVVFYFNITLFLILLYIYGYIFFLLFFDSNKIESTELIEILFGIVTLYFIFFFCKMKNTTRVATVNIYCFNLMFGLFFWCLAGAVKCKPKGLKIKTWDKLEQMHKIIIIILIFIYFIKLYFCGFSSNIEFSTGTSENSIFSFRLSGFFFKKSTTCEFGLGAFYIDDDIFFSHNMRFFNLHKEVCIQYYKNFLFLINQFVLKFLSPTYGGVFLFYSSLILIIPILFIFVCLWKPKVKLVFV